MTEATQVILQGAKERVLAWLPVIQQVQDEYRSRRGHYAQSLLMASTHPSDGGTVPLDRGHAKPTDQPEAPVDLFSELPASLRANVKVDAYDSTFGKGYVVVCYHMITNGEDKGLWVLHLNFGPETWRERDWERVPDEVEYVAD